MQGKTIYFDGAINAENEGKFNKLVNKGGNVLVIKSPGGDVEVGLRMALTLREKNMTVIVKDYCISSCANYVFLTAKSKFLPPDSVLGLHGAPILDSNAEQAAHPPELLKIYAAHREFFDQNGIDVTLFKKSMQALLLPKPVYAFTITDRIRKKVAKFSDRAEATEELHECLAKNKKTDCAVEMTAISTVADAVYFPSRATLEQFGVTGIGVYSYPTTAQKMAALGDVISPGFKLLGDLAATE